MNSLLLGIGSKKNSPCWSSRQKTKKEVDELYRSFAILANIFESQALEIRRFVMNFLKDNATSIIDREALNTFKLPEYVFFHKVDGVSSFIGSNGLSCPGSCVPASGPLVQSCCSWRADFRDLWRSQVPECHENPGQQDFTSRPEPETHKPEQDKSFDPMRLHRLFGRRRTFFNSDFESFSRPALLLTKPGFHQHR